ncbi:MAG: hypothetical protein ACXAC2_10460 [Candidatus Kariarchaeaceae archaeon]|jgi:hypothetical protein
MQLPTHVLVGIVIQFLVFQLFEGPTWLLFLLVIVFGFSSHFFVDALAKITYHPPDRQPGNFWLRWHLFVYLFGVFLIVIYIQTYFIGMLAANLVDIWDWLFLRNYAKRKNQPDWGKRYYLHPIANRIRLLLFSRLPNLAYTKLGILPEATLYFLWFCLFLVDLLFRL